MLLRDGEVQVDQPGNGLVQTTHGVYHPRGIALFTCANRKDVYIFEGYRKFEAGKTIADCRPRVNSLRAMVKIHNPKGCPCIGHSEPIILRHYMDQGLNRYVGTKSTESIGSEFRCTKRRKLNHRSKKVQSTIFNSIFFERPNGKMTNALGDTIVNHESKLPGLPKLAELIRSTEEFGTAPFGWDWSKRPIQMSQKDIDGLMGWYAEFV